MTVADLLLGNLKDRRTQLVLAALVLTLLTFFVRPVSLTRQGLEFLAVVDVTGSMNVRDYRGADGKPASRIDTAKAALIDLIGRLPCGSRMALGIFTERRTFLLFTPIEVCDGFAPLSGAIQGIDYRMAWEGDSRIASGLFRAVEVAASLNTDLMFITDGHEAPPLPSQGGPTFEGKPGAVRGLIVGAGDRALSQIPKFDDRGREVGFYGETDVLQENRFGPPPPDAEYREGYNARNSPFGGVAARGSEHLSAVRESYLKTLAGQTGLSYAHLDGPSGLAKPLFAAATPRPLPGSLDLRPYLGSAALTLLLAAFAAGSLAQRTGFRRRPYSISKKA